MTDDERKAEKAKSMAASVYRAMDYAQREEDYVRQIHAKWSDHPAYRKYMDEMLLRDRVAEYVARPKMTRA